MKELMNAFWVAARELLKKGLNEIKWKYGILYQRAWGLELQRTPTTVNTVFSFLRMEVKILKDNVWKPQPLKSPSPLIFPRDYRGSI